MTTLDLANARPVLLIGGAERPELAAALARLEIAERIDGLYRAELSFAAWGQAAGGPGFLFMDRKVLDFGARLEIRRGDLSLFIGRISALEGEFPAGGLPLITVLAEDRLMDLRCTRRSRSFLSVTDAELMERVAAEHKLKTKIDLPGPRHAALAQLNQSDLAFLRERAWFAGGELWIADDTLHVAPRPGRAGAALTLSWGQELREFRATADLADQVHAVQVSGWDAQARQAAVASAGASAIQPELGADEAGGAIATRAFGQRTQTVVHTLPRTAAEATAEAEALARAVARRFVCGTGVCEPAARLRVGALVELTSLGPLFTGSYRVVGLRHLYDLEQGLRTELSVERPGLGRTS